MIDQVRKEKKLILFLSTQAEDPNKRVDALGWALQSAPSQECRQLSKHTAAGYFFKKYLAKKHVRTRIISGLPNDETLGAIFEDALPRSIPAM